MALTVVQPSGINTSATFTFANVNVSSNLSATGNAYFGNLNGGNLNLTGNIFINGVPSINQWKNFGSNIYFNDGNVGIDVSSEIVILFTSFSGIKYNVYVNAENVFDEKEINPESLTELVMLLTKSSLQSGHL